MVAIRIFLFTIAIQFAFSTDAGSAGARSAPSSDFSASASSAGAFSTDASSAPKPQGYAIAQQVGAVCFLSCWYNFDLIQKARSRNRGEFRVTSELLKNRREWFLVTYEPFAQWYRIFRTQSTMAGSPFARFIERVKSESITLKDGQELIADQDPINQRAGIHHFPHLFLEGSDANHLYSPTPDLIVTVKLDVSATGKIDLGIRVSQPAPVELLGQTLYRVTNAMLDEDRAFYNFGLYKLMLMAARVKSDNTVVTDGATDRESLEVLQLHHAMRRVPNPWSTIDRDHFLEYQVAGLFKTNPTLKRQAIAVVDVFFKTFGFYTDAQRLGLRAKMIDLPGEDQMLSYSFCQSLRKLSAASVGEAAVIEVLELETGEAEQIYKLLGTNLSKFLKKKFTEPQDVLGGKEVSFADVWKTVKDRLNLTDGTDMVTFSSHGAVLSFDSKLLRLQKFEDQDLANFLGFVTMDSSYAKGLKPFYQVEGDSSI